MSRTEMKLTSIVVVDRVLLVPTSKTVMLHQTVLLVFAAQASVEVHVCE